MSPDRRRALETGTAIDFARAAVIDGEPRVGEAGIGRHLTEQTDPSGLTVHEFECLLPAYPGWRWTVVLATIDGAAPTICDVVLLPGEGALLAPRWVPWRDRVQPGDLGPGDILPSDPNDARLEPGYSPTLEVGDEDVLDAVWELGLGRERLLSSHGRDVAVERWLDGSTGPESPDAKLAPHPCVTCGFFVGIKGSFNQEFGVCANEFSPVDGRVVSVRFGCGAHSSITTATTAEATATLDEFEYQSFDLRSDDSSEKIGENQSSHTAQPGTDGSAEHGHQGSADSSSFGAVGESRGDVEPADLAAPGQALLGASAISDRVTRGRGSSGENDDAHHDDDADDGHGNHDEDDDEDRSEADSGALSMLSESIPEGVDDSNEFHEDAR